MSIAGRLPWSTGAGPCDQPAKPYVYRGNQPDNTISLEEAVARIREFAADTGKSPRPAGRSTTREPHGTVARYNWHLRHGVPACPACRIARREESRRLREEGKSQ